MLVAQQVEPTRTLVGERTFRPALRYGKSIARLLAYRSGLLDLTRRLNHQRAAILRYHSISEDSPQNEFYRAGEISVPPAAFERQMAFIRKHYRAISMDRLVESLERRQPLPHRSVAITFDDGYKDNFVHAYPILRRHGLPATFYITTGYIGNQKPLWIARLRHLILRTSVARLSISEPVQLDESLSTWSERREAIGVAVKALKRLDPTLRDEVLQSLEARLGVRLEVGDFQAVMMSWDDVGCLVSGGMTVGSHTMTHPILTALEPDEACREISESKEEIERRTGARVAHFGYPNGGGMKNYSDAVDGLILGSGYRSAVVSDQGGVGSRSNRFRLKRIGISDAYRRLPDFVFRLETERFR